MGEYYAVYQSGAELLGVGLTSAEALQDAERWRGIGRSPPSRPTDGAGRAGKRAEPIISAHILRNFMRPCMPGIGASRMRSMRKAILRCSTHARPNPYPDWGKVGNAHLRPYAETCLRLRLDRTA